MFCKDCKITWVLGIILLIVIMPFCNEWLDKYYSMLITGIIPTILGGVAVYYTVQALKLTQQQAHEATIINAWNVLTTPAPGNSGKKEALETLAKAGKSLDGIDLSSKRNGGWVSLDNLKLQGVDLWNANFTDANLINATFIIPNLRGTNFTRSNLNSATIIGTVGKSNFTDAVCRGLQTKEACLFYSTNLTRTDLRFSDFTQIFFDDCYISTDKQSDLPTLPQGWKAEFVRDENGEPKPHTNGKGFLIEIVQVNPD